MQKAVQSTEFWQEVDIFVTVLQKIYATLRANDSEVPGTPDIYFRMSSGLADVQTNEWELPDGTSFKFSAAERKVVLDAYKQRLDMLYNRLGPRAQSAIAFKAQVRRDLHGRNATVHRRLLRERIG